MFFCWLFIILAWRIVAIFLLDDTLAFVGLLGHFLDVAGSIYSPQVSSQKFHWVRERSQVLGIENLTKL